MGFVFAATLLLELLAASALIAACLRLSSFVAASLVVYVAFVALNAALVWALSPFELVTKWGVLIVGAVFAGAAFGLWLRREAPRFPPLSLAALRRIAGDPVLAVLVVAVAASSLYELVLVVGAPPNNWDSLTYHLTRVAAWAQDGGVHWVQNAPTDRINEFQPLAEQQILTLFAVSGRSLLYALPQWLAGLAAAIAVYTAATHLGLEDRAAAFAALVFATFPLVALESTTAQNDLVAGALMIAAVALVLSGSRAEVAVAGVAIGLALGAKLTTAYALPIPLALALLRGRRDGARLAIVALVSFVTLGMWGFALNLAHTGSVLGHGGGRTEQQATPSLTGSPATAVRVVHDLLDLSGLSLRLTNILAVCGVMLGVVVFALARRRGTRARFASLTAIAAALPLLAARAIPVAAHGMKIAADAVSLPVAARGNTGGTFFWGVDFGSSEDLSSFGVIGGPLLLALSVALLIRRRDARVVALAAALPTYVVLLALTSKYNPWLSRFLLVPVAVAAPLLALVYRWRAAAAAIAAVAVLELALVHVHNEQKPFAVRPWEETRAQAIAHTYRPGFAAAVAALDRLSPSALGAVVGSDDPTFLLYGEHLDRSVTYLPRQNAVAAASRDGLDAVVVSGASARHAFGAAGWRLLALGGTWSLATRR